MGWDGMARLADRRTTRPSRRFATLRTCATHARTHAAPSAGTRCIGQLDKIMEVRALRPLPLPMAMEKELV
jgi:hypothetical protein